MTKLQKIFSIGLIALLLIGAGFLFKDIILKGYSASLKNLQKIDIGNVINEVGQELSNPPPLIIGGISNNVTLSAEKVIDQTNVARKLNGNLPALSENTKLNAAALAKAKDLFAKQYFEHVSPSGVDPGTLVKESGYQYVEAGENLILGNFKDEKEVVDLWMASPGHRANILNNRFVDIGVAVVKGTYQGQARWIGVQEFGLPLDSCPPEPSQAAKSAIDTAKTQLNNWSAQLDVKEKDINATPQNSPEYNQKVDEYNQLAAQYNLLASKTKALIANYNNQLYAFNKCVIGK